MSVFDVVWIVVVMDLAGLALGVAAYLWLLKRAGKESER